VSADSLPTTQIDGVVWQQAIVGNTVYAGGSFANARPAGSAAGTNLTPRNNFLSYDLTTGALNTAFTTGTPEQTDAIAVASQLRGGYVEAGYDLLRLLAPGTTQDVTAFFRYDYANTQAAVAAGFTANPALIRYTETVGLVYRPIPEVGIKADYRRHEFGAGPSYNELATALTWMF
jgi:hypothetical protein